MVSQKLLQLEEWRLNELKEIRHTLIHCVYDMNKTTKKTMMKKLDSVILSYNQGLLK